jgi:hypothetical protein
VSTELTSLKNCEDRAEEAVKQVNRGMERFAVELKAIRDLNLWQDDYDSFEEYCEKRWGRTMRTVQRALKAHTARQKLLAGASEKEKPVIEAASTKTMEAVAAVPEPDRMSHLLIGRKEPKAKHLADFYSSEPKADNGIEFTVSDGVRMGESKKTAPDGAEPERQIATRILKKFIETQPEEHRPYLQWVAEEIGKTT